MNPVRTSQTNWFASGTAIVAGLAAAKLVFHLYTGRHYGYFVDELYYLACSQHLASGYVDQAPLIAFIAKFVRMTLGDSLAAIRFLPGVAGAGLVLLTGFLARETGRRAVRARFGGACGAGGAGVSRHRQSFHHERV